MSKFICLKDINMKQSEFSVMKNQIGKLKQWQLKELREAIDVELNSTNCNTLVLTEQECDMIRMLFLGSYSDSDQTYRECPEFCVTV